MGNHMGFMQLAINEARKALDIGEIPVGAVIVQDGKVIAACHNLRETEGDPTAHAEVLAIRKAAAALGRRRLNGCTLYVTLEPCPMCAGAILLSQLDACVFGASDPAQGCCGSVYDLIQDPAFTHRVNGIGGVMVQEAQELLHTFFAGKRG